MRYSAPGFYAIKATGTVGKRQAVRPVHHVQNHTCRVTLLQLAMRAAVSARPSSLFASLVTHVNLNITHTVYSLSMSLPYFYKFKSTNSAIKLEETHF
jgi:hypothetical protein